MIAAIALAATLGRFVIFHGTVDAYGVRGNATIVVDRRTGDFVRRFDAGPASEQEGFDGVHAWRADATGMPRVQGNTRERGEILQWSQALRGAIGTFAHHVHLSGATDRVDVAFENYHWAGTTALPGRIVFRSMQNGTWTADIGAVRVASSMPSSSFAPPAYKSADFHLTHVTRIPIAMTIGSPTVPVKANGVPFTFLFDTGGQNVITFEAAKKLHLRVLGSGVVNGGGGGTASIGYAFVKSVRVGDAELLDQPFIVLPASALPGVDGIVGYELLARAAARLDMAHGTLELAPDAAAFGKSIAPQHFDYYDRQPQVAGSLDDVTGAFSIDTGSSLTAQVQTPAVRRGNLLKRLNATVIAHATDVGGRYPIYLARASAIRLGNAPFFRPIVDLLVRESTSNNASIIANVGDGILRRWIIVFDYLHQTIDFRSGGDPAGNIVHDHSGIVLGTKHNAVVAAQVFGGTPSAEAGIAEGATIAAVNGTAVEAGDLERVRTLLRSKPGTVVRIQLGDRTSHEVTLRAYL